MSQTLEGLDRLFKSDSYQQMLRDAKRREEETHRKLLEMWNNLLPANSQDDAGESA